MSRPGRSIRQKDPVSMWGWVDPRTGPDNKIFFFFFYWLYNPGWVLVCSTILFHSCLSSTFALQQIIWIFISLSISNYLFRLPCICPQFPRWTFAAMNFFYRVQSLAARPTPTWRVRVSLFVWVLSFDLSGKGGPTSSYATAGIALRVTIKSNYRNIIGLQNIIWQLY